MKRLSLLWKKFHKLHLGLYVLFSLAAYFGSSTAFIFERYSLIDIPLLKTEWRQVSEARARGGSYKPSAATAEKIFKPLAPGKPGGADGAIHYEARARSLDLSFLFLLLWLLPLYKYYFSKKPQDLARVERRIIHLPLVIFVLGWVLALQRFLGNLSAYSGLYGGVPGRVTVVFAVSAVLLGAFVSYLNLELTGLYVRGRIAGPFFKATDPYGLKHGFAINLTLRYALLIFSLGMVPLLLSLYFPVLSNLDVFTGLGPGGISKLLSSPDSLRVLLPVLVLAGLVALILVFQAASIALSRLNVQAPVSGLLRRMKAVAAGDLDCRTSVLYTDEFGQLKGHFNLMVDGLRERERRLEAARAEASRLESELAVSKATSDLAAQVAHDIRSPLAAMGAAARGLQLPVGQRELLENSARRIQEIADDLLRRYRAPSADYGEEKPRPCPLAALLEAALAEKRLQYKDRAGVKILFESGAGGARAVVEPKGFQRLVSNLVNNAVEAFDGGGTVTVTLSEGGGGVTVAVRDDGRGIPPELLPRLGQKGETHGKAGGTGLGLYHARASAEGWGGRLEIASAPGGGTTVSLVLPSVAVAAVRSTVLLDDDPLVHLNWKLAAKAAGAGLKAFETPGDFYSALGSLPKDTPIYIDSELGGGAKGEEIARDLHEKGYSDLTLATGHDAGAFGDLTWLKVTGKEPPFGGQQGGAADGHLL